MNYIEFRGKYLNRAFPDTDGVYGTQCVDLVKSYIKEVYGENYQAMYGNGGAKEAYWLYPNSLITTSNWERIPNTTTFVPNQGDIVVFEATANNPYGHIGVVDSANVNTMQVLNTNWINKNATINTFNYINPKCLGFLRHKGLKPQPTPPVQVEIKETVIVDNSKIEELGKINASLLLDLKKQEELAKHYQNEVDTLANSIKEKEQAEEQKVSLIDYNHYDLGFSYPTTGDKIKEEAKQNNFAVDMNKIKEGYFKSGGLEGSIIGTIASITAYLFYKGIIGEAEAILVGTLASGLVPLMLAKIGKFIKS